MLLRMMDELTRLGRQFHTDRGLILTRKSVACKNPVVTGATATTLSTKKPEREIATDRGDSASAERERDP